MFMLKDLSCTFTLRDRFFVFMLRDHSDNKIGCESVDWMYCSQDGVM